MSWWSGRTAAISSVVAIHFDDFFRDRSLLTYIFSLKLQHISFQHTSRHFKLTANCSQRLRRPHAPAGLFLVAISHRYGLVGASGAEWAVPAGWEVLRMSLRHSGDVPLPLGPLTTPLRPLMTAHDVDRDQAGQPSRIVSSRKILLKIYSIRRLHAIPVG